MKNLAKHNKNLENISKTLPKHSSLQSKQHRTTRNKTKHTHAHTTKKQEHKTKNKQTNKQYKQYKNNTKQTQEAGPTICAHDLGTQAGPTICANTIWKRLETWSLLCSVAMCCCVARRACNMQHELLQSYCLCVGRAGGSERGPVSRSMWGYLILTPY